MITENVYCDRCKKLIKTDWVDSWCNHLYKRKFSLTRGAYDEQMDLCQDCYNSLRDWIKNGKENDNEEKEES